MDTKPVVMPITIAVTTFWNLVIISIWSFAGPLTALFFHPTTEVKIISAIWLAVAFSSAHKFLNSKDNFGKTRKLVMGLGPLAVMVLAVIF